MVESSTHSLNRCVINLYIALTLSAPWWDPTR